MYIIYIYHFFIFYIKSCERFYFKTRRSMVLLNIIFDYSFFVFRG